MNNFITNSGTENLKKRLIELIKKSDELKFLVGFCYFSGVRELYEGLKNKENINLKILVGLNVDKTVFGLFEHGEEDGLSGEEKQQKFIESIKNSLNSDEFDNEEFFIRVKLFLKLIAEDKIVIRKTNKPNHAKLYLFKLDDSQVGNKTLFITGSSNLTKAGLSEQQEFNVEIGDYGFKEVEEGYFDKLWDEAVKLTEKDELKKIIIETIIEKTLIKEPTPFEAFVIVLKEYLRSFKEKEVEPSLIELMKEKKYQPFSYQIDAVKQALAIIEENGGVIIADVVGLGKSVIASMIAKQIGKRGIVICPPGLIGADDAKSGWKKYLEDFELSKLGWQVFSRGELETIFNFVKDKKDIETIIIDEAHRFRNEDTFDYDILKNICRDRKIMLLTATPFNNKPDDILALLQLFVTPKKSKITLEDNLKDKFRKFGGIFDRLSFINKNHNSINLEKKKKAQNYYKNIFNGEKEFNLKKVKQRAGILSQEIKETIEPVTIRRNRLDLEKNSKYKKEVGELPKLQDPEEWLFELNKEQEEFYDDIIKYFQEPDNDNGGKFSGAVYRPFEYEKRIKDTEEKLSEEDNFNRLQQKNLHDFMRRLLIKRFESSFGAFEQSIKNFHRIYAHILDFIRESKGKYVLDRKLIEKICEDDYEEIEEELNDFAEKLKNGNYPKKNKIYELDKFERKTDFLNDIGNDIKLFEKILERIKELKLEKDDPKTVCLIKNIKTKLKEKIKTGEPKRKIVIFTEYVDTVKHLEKTLLEEFNNRVLVIAGSKDLNTKHKIESIYRNFDASLEKQEDNFDILLATDSISEGFNLNRADLVVSYDIPWNPVRVIQRVGRINRISKKVFSELHLANFFPTEKGANFVRSREIAQNKMFLIHNILGEDAKIFNIDEEPKPAELFRRLTSNPEEEKEGFYTFVLNKIKAIEKENPEIVMKIKQFPPRIKTAKKYPSSSLLVFMRKGGLHVRECLTGEDDKKIIISPTIESIYEKIVCEKNEKQLPLSNIFWPRYLEAKNFKEQAINLADTSLEQKALATLNLLLSKSWPEFLPYFVFLRTLREDIVDYGTLPAYTLRRLANLKLNTEKEIKEALTEILVLKEALGEDYLIKEKAKQNNIKPEVIIAIENQ